MSSEDGPRSETVVPDRRSVADLRRHITSQLEMKAPESSRGPNRAEAADSPVPSRQFPHNFVKVHEGADPESKKPYFGRVLDGPVVLSPDKFYQGVMPASLIQPLVPASIPTPDTKPPSPMPKTGSKFSKRNSFINRLARESSPVENHDYAQDEGSRQLEQPEKPTAAPQNENGNRLPDEVEASRPSSSTHELPSTTPPPYRTAPFTEKSFETVFQAAAAPAEKDRHGSEQMKSPVTPVKDELKSSFTENRMPDLLKSRSPAPFSYSASPNPEILSTAAVQDLTSSLTEALASFSKTPPASNVTSDSGYDGDGALQQTPQDRTPRTEQSFSDHKFDTISSTENWSRSTQEAMPSIAPMGSEGGRQTNQGSLPRGSELPASSVPIEAGADRAKCTTKFAHAASSTHYAGRCSLLVIDSVQTKMHKIDL
ncbi:hypothetical protein OSTOST_06198, partial [Ostertagia ostertagi]